MKTILLLLISFSGYAQVTTIHGDSLRHMFGTGTFERATFINNTRTKEQVISDSLRCVGRGHIKSDVFSKMGGHQPAYYIDTDTSTVVVFTPESITYGCARCKTYITEYNEPIRQIIWKKEKTK